MNADDLLMLLLGQLPGRLPLLIALVVAVAMVLRHRAADPVPGRLALWGFGLMLAAQLLGLFLYPMLQAYIFGAGLPLGGMRMLHAVAGLGLAVVEAAALVLLALAVVRRSR
ncbi:hypothetical protein [Luteimonas sp. FCS-9]|uniref:hypothetical protein n=1 Tax=Luteimonas sp. FCS-9 TaxID=1547516 RepID=UPI00063EB6D1|nr:hypothetical protein [Luteimonas sp. FCS-9]KLI98096.1 hypothetical protein WQ56_15930 [Luteimonas sp. FCS-9]